ncbi:hypothetical protein DM813_18905 [Pseudomonas alkylphenolica]|uniref:Uncharacterized protein n=1 Tax=Pseudomonas alkylphenolica TaxID=237609 RepID=A0A443ZQA2_9PSED|nr:hypothetical protein [Pseudomonas alkylphenolica]RWU21260.1 hypothetical protein DM813_18905 [Pseudomonas alkylphenolica]
MNDYLEVNFEGNTYKVRYSVKGKIIDVSFGFISRTTQVGGSSILMIAEILAHEVLEEAKATGQLR